MENLLKNRNLAGLLQFQLSSFFPSGPGGNRAVQPNFNVGLLHFQPNSFFSNQIPKPVYELVKSLVIVLKYILIQNMVGKL
jgi:hypothetical protein